MAEIDRMIAEVRQWRRFHIARDRSGVKGACIEAAACAIREKALLDARVAIIGRTDPGYEFRSVISL